jgi:hypothetical protein
MGHVLGEKKPLGLHLPRGYKGKVVKKKRLVQNLIESFQSENQDARA